MFPNITIGAHIYSSWFTMLFLGAVITMALALLQRPKDCILTSLELVGLSAGITVISLAGARILFVILHFGVSGLNITNLLSAQGGFAYYGALLFSVLALVTYAKLRRKSFWAILDYCMPFLIISQVFVRIGCFMAGCCYGKPTGTSLGCVFKTVDRIPRHPTQLYEAVLLLIVYFIGRAIYKKHLNLRGFTFFISLAMYGLGRFFIEFLRTDSKAVMFNLTVAEISSFIIGGTALFIAVKLRKNMPKTL